MYRHLYKLLYPIYHIRVCIACSNGFDRAKGADLVLEGLILISHGQQNGRKKKKLKVFTMCKTGFNNKL